MTAFDVAYVRAQFPALARNIEGRAAAYLDGPGGTQVPERVVDAVTDYLINHNCNIHGVFATSEETDLMLERARCILADLLGCDGDEVSFGANMTTLTILLGQGIARRLRAGDEVLITQLDHEGNRSSWQLLEERGITVREAPVDLETLTIDWDSWESLLSEKTKLVAIGYASNATGTVNDVRRASAAARQIGALSFIDAVHYVPHGFVDVRGIDCDFLVCSPYKFFGPHLGVMYVRREVSERVDPLKLAPQEDFPPYRYETGTLNHEAIAGAAEAVEFIADLGRHHAGNPGEIADRRAAVMAGMRAVEAYEKPLAMRLMEGLSALPGVRLYGPPAQSPRTPTVSFTLGGLGAREVASRLGARGLFVWDGDFYATRLVDVLGLVERGGLVRVGLAPYNTLDEVERLIAAVGELAGSRI